jgi:hypothetical protein
MDNTSDSDFLKETAASVTKGEVSISKETNLKGSIGAILASFLKSLTGALNVVSDTVSDTVKTLPKIGKVDYYNKEELLGVQSPKNEIDGLMGLSSQYTNNTLQYKKIPVDDIYRFTI